MKYLRIVVPSLAEASLRRVLSEIPRIHGSWVIDPIVYGTGNDEAAEAFPTIRFVEVPPDNGIGSIVRRGFSEAVTDEADAVVKLDGDGQHDPFVLRDIMEALDEGSSFVLVSRYRMPLVAEPPIDRELLNTMVTSTVNALTGWSLTDACSGYFGCTTELADELISELQTTSYGVGLELLLRLAVRGGRVTELSQHPNYRHGNGKFAKIYHRQMLTARSERAAVYLRVMSNTLQSLASSGMGSKLRELHPRRIFRPSAAQKHREGRPMEFTAKVFPLPARQG